MKFNLNYVLPIAVSMFAMSAQAETPEFQEADKNGDGVLSIEEASTALPELEISDDNGDGLVNHIEAENSVSGLELPMSAEFDDVTIAPVGANEYRMIVQALTANRNQA